MKEVYYFKVRIKLKINAKRTIIEKRQKRVCSIIAIVKNWLKYWAEIFIRIFWLAFFEKYGPK
jgi:hypothetical protein